MVGWTAMTYNNFSAHQKIGTGGLMGDFEVQDWMELAVSDNEDLPNVRIRKLDQFEDELAILAGRPT
jgi:hypothetical protein